MKKRILCLLLCTAMVILISSGAVSGTAEKSSLSALEDKLANAASQRAAAEKALDDAKNNYVGAIKEKQAIDQKIYATNLEIDALLELIDGYNAEIAKKEEEITSNNELLNSKYQVVRERIRAKHEDGNVDFLTVLFDADGLSDFFTQVDRFLCMLEYDKQLLESYNAGLDTLTTMKEALTAEKAKLDSKVKILAQRRSELEADLASANNLVATTENRISTAEADLEYIAAIEEEYNKKREALLAELARTTNKAYVGGKFLWPLDSAYQRVSSGFGWRVHPVTGKDQFHIGIDIPAPYGSNIYAVNDGTVVECSYNYADGYYITVSHGGGIASFYSHLSKYRVAVGDTVKKGDIIANVGTSGYTTGPHLNLNIYENNSPVNPLGFFGG